MKPPRAPRLDERRTAEFSSELHARAHAWMPTWGIRDGERDVGAALLDIAARFNSEVAERLDRSGEKMRRGFLDWLAVRGAAARPARMPVSFKLADAARSPVLAEAPVRLQADAAGTPVVFETEEDVRVIPGRLQVVVGVDAGADAFHVSPPGISDLQPLEPLPVRWEVKSFAAAGSHTLQLDPETGLGADTLVEVAGHQYRIVQADKGIVTIEPGLDADLPSSAMLRKVTAFDPFGGAARNRQEHALYLGDMDLLNVEAAATIDVIGAMSLVAGISWEYWGKLDGTDEVAWQKLTVALELHVAGAVRLEKRKGAIVPREIAGNSSRWIRAYARNAAGAAPMLQVEALQLLINHEPAPLACSDAANRASPAAEAMANTTALVLDGVFFPLGKEPRQFDAFYLGSQEAFSKKAAKVQLCFEMSDPTFTALSAVREGGFANTVLAGVAADRALHLFALNQGTGTLDKFREREPLQPPGVALDKQPGWALPIWYEPATPSAREQFLVAASAGDDIWAWREDAADGNTSNWESFEAIPTTNPPPATPISGLVYLGGANPELVALRNYQMSRRPRAAGQPWVKVPTLHGAATVKLRSIVPVISANAWGQRVTSSGDGMVGIADDGALFGVSNAGACTRLLSLRTFAKDVRPVAVRLAGGDIVVVAVEVAPYQLVAWQVTAAVEEHVPITPGTVVANLDAEIFGAVLHVFAAVQDGATGRLNTWMPFGSGMERALFSSKLDASGAQVGGAPTIVGTRVVMPGNRADLLVTEFDPARRHVESRQVEVGVVVPSALTLGVNDVIVDNSGAAPVISFVTQPALVKDGETLLVTSPTLPTASTRLDAYALSSRLTGTLLVTGDLKLDPTDHETTLHSQLYMGGELFSVDQLDKSAQPWTATVSNVNGAATPPLTADYVRPMASGGRVVSFIRMGTPNSVTWDAGLLARLPLVFPSLVNPIRYGKAFSVGVGNKPDVVVLDLAIAPIAAIAFVVDEAVGPWSRLLGDTSVNPELSWEYWNGRAWWKLLVTLDETRNLKSKGALRFTVPSDIAPSDWAGKTNFWIRARLVGGDYGRETVTATTKVVNGVTEQTIKRSSEGIRAPSVLKLSISYSVDAGVLPTFVKSQDSGSVRDQSEANRTAGATVEAFIPLAVALGQLSNAAPSHAARDECPPDCGCQQAQAVANAAASGEIPAVAQSSGRALLIGLDASPAGAPVNVFLVVDEEHDHWAFAPLLIEALVADRFVPIVARDATRGLGESGILSMSFTVEPTRRELFGQSLTWLRLTPAAGADSVNWTPSLRGAYLNTAWASATETLTRELVGSSEGAPNLTLTLARPPVLDHTLELRVREPLGEEELADLRKADERSVISDVDGLAGHWVLWNQVTDPGDESARARAYALDEPTGTISFGDGVHGLIPPIGLDAIVAFSYKRTEPPRPGSDIVPSNLVSARASLNLVSPVESVEAVMSVDQSAGGAAPENDDRVLRFGVARMRHRDRVVTARDIEDLALQRSSDVVQARCFPRSGFVRLVVAMRGANPVPGAAQVRELRRALLEGAPASLSAPKALRITGPTIRRLRIELTLRVDELEHAGALAEGVKRRLSALFDAAIGGPSQEGWPLGANPLEEDIALALIDAPHLDSIVKVAFEEIATDGSTSAWPAALAPHELAMLDDDPIRIHIATAEVVA